MTNAVKERILNLISRDNEQYQDIVNFFLDYDVNEIEKTLRADKIISNEIPKYKNNDLNFPERLVDLERWISQNHNSQCLNYSNYLERRRNGGKREFFQTVSEAYEFLYKVAPVKRVDGSWLYSLTKHWNDQEYRGLIQIYLEELGLGIRAKNHVCLFENLLTSHGLNQFLVNLGDEYYHQAAVQLALAYASSEFIPEILGFNLGYEQLPLHLLITNYELKELGIDSRYFNLHITIDNYDNGHAKLALESIQKISRRYDDEYEFMKKLKAGFALNDAGLSSNTIIQNLDTEAMVLNILQKKAIIGRHMHNNRCVIANKTTNEWLSDNENVSLFVQVLKDNGWIRLNEDPSNSRFWNMLNDDGKMSGVFSDIEKAFIYDWIAGTESDKFSYQVKPQLIEKFLDMDCIQSSHPNNLESLQHDILGINNIKDQLSKLVLYLSPHYHSQEIGLWSSRKYVEILYPYLATRN
ncbi:iron-containing redox enzyme family protein [Acinetobacter chinensis]|uniref:Iron-containing redox enzyme family protein n=1 Tax=Acinetobacter chinensis TaxID=2004650 RepID=A0A3B7LUX2_9GAMM|nr:iron-containing redox enzyme family protein [Acinetobacter chinensis]AXY56660.1 iron-containing redox enzyme family protein [Acinetobacter chinensis]